MRLPPLNALRAFEAAARHGGYIAAAEELNVTRGAISRHVKALEDHLGVALFQRYSRGVELNAAGTALLPVLTQAFRQMSDGIDRITRTPADLRIICPPATSIRWLMPRLGGFRDRYPDFRMQITTDYYARSGYDTTAFNLGISVENWHDRRPDTMVYSLVPMVISPACTPEIAVQLKTPADLAKVTLLHERHERTDWQIWLDAFPTPGIDVSTGDVFHNLDMAVKAAEIGAGVVMVDLLLGRRELDMGTLVLPFPDMMCDTEYGRFALIGNTGTWNDPAVVAFRTWIGEIAETDTHQIFSNLDWKRHAEAT